MAKSKNYWEKRERERMELVDSITEDEIGRVLKSVNVAYGEVQDKITNIYVKYAKDNKLNYTDALKYLKDDERKEFQKDLKFYTDKYHDSEYIKENKKYLHALSVRARVSRLEELQATLKTSADTLYRSLDKDTRDSLKRVMEESYKHTAFSIFNGKEAALNVPSNKDFDKLMETPWSGKNYSEKIWDTASNFESKLSSVINKGLVQGKSYEEMARELRHGKVGKDRNGGTVYECKRLISTEASFVQQQGTKLYYDEIGLDEYEYCATLDNKTSDICQGLDGKLFKVQEVKVGVNYPPMHCFCRSTTIPVVRWEDEEIGEEEKRMERGDDGRNRIISKVSYDEWKNKNFGLSANAKEENHTEIKEAKLIEDLSNTSEPERYEILKAYENYMTTLDYETCVVITDKGKVYEIIGTNNRVHPEVLGDGLKGALVTHNHPKTETEFSFSKDDFELFKNYKMKILRGVDYLYEYEYNLDSKYVDEYSFDYNLEGWSYYDEWSKGWAIDYNCGYRRKKR